NRQASLFHGGLDKANKWSAYFLTVWRLRPPGFEAQIFLVKHCQQQNKVLHLAVGSGVDIGVDRLDLLNKNLKSTNHPEKTIFFKIDLSVLGAVAPELFRKYRIQKWLVTGDN